jgi:hypothetical protein
MKRSLIVALACVCMAAPPPSAQQRPTTRDWVPPQPEDVLQELALLTAELVRTRSTELFVRSLTELGQRYTACFEEKRSRDFCKRQ